MCCSPLLMAVRKIIGVPRDFSRSRNQVHHGGHRAVQNWEFGDFRRPDGPALCGLSRLNQRRLRVWRQQPKAFFSEAILEVDGSIVGTTGECKQGMDLSYKGVWGYHPLLISLANTHEVLYVVNRPGNRPSRWPAPADSDRRIGGLVGPTNCRPGAAAIRRRPGA